MKAEITVTGHGPLLDGQWRTVMPAAISQAVNAVADHAVNLLHSKLHASLKHPTGHFESRIVTDRSFESTVIDDPVVYGPWLEGVGSRNAASRFKGYAVFRRTTQQADREAKRTAEPKIAAAVRRLG